MSLKPPPLPLPLLCAYGGKKTKYRILLLEAAIGYCHETLSKTLQLWRVTVPTAIGTPTCTL